MKFKFFFLTLPFLYLFLLLAQPDRALTQDLGRHIKTGKIIVNCLCIPNTNLFSYTEPSHPFINHHWGSEVTFYFFYRLFGLNSILILKIILITLALFIVCWLAIQKASTFWVLSFAIPYFYIFSERFDSRPEIFSFLFIALFIGAIQNYRKTKALRSLFALPLIEFIWVNTHIYFFVGIMLFLLLLVDEFARRRGEFDRRLLGIFVFLIGVTLLNPNGIRGVVLPFTVLQDYGYPIQENQNVFFLNEVLPNTKILVLEGIVALLGIGIVVNRKRIDIFFLLVSISTTTLALLMIRNIPLFVLATLPYIPLLYTQIEKKITITNQGFLHVTKGVIIIVLVLFIFVTVRNRVASPYFGFSYVEGAVSGVDFLRENNIRGPIFNNFDIGSYLVFRLFPQERVFVDGRPEAYSPSFFKDYIRMQKDQSFFEEQVEHYRINVIFFAHTDNTPWGRMFMNTIVRNEGWAPVYLDRWVLILVRNVDQNKDIIKRLRIDLLHS